jgi:two-component sensor histidine kinase
VNEPITPLPDPVRQVVEDTSRREVLEALEIMGSAPDSDFDRLTGIAARLFNVDFALVTLLDEQRQWFKSCFGPVGFTESPIGVSFCAHTIAAPDSDHMVVCDLASDQRFARNPFVIGPPHVRFYAGAPITVRGQRLGTLCVLGTQPREDVPDALIRQLVDLAAVAGTLVELKDEARVRARTAAELMREEWRHALTLEAGKVGSWVWDMRTGELSCNDTFRRMFGLSETGTVSMDEVFNAIEPDDMPSVQNTLGAAFNEGGDFDAEMRIPRTSRWLTARGRVYQRDATGKPLVMMGASLDVTDARRSAEQTRLLLRELNHRVKNTLAMIQSVARQTIRQSPDPQDFIDAFSGRLRTLSDTHVLLANRDWQGVQLYDVLAVQLGPDFLSQPDRADVSGADMLLPADHALGLGLILHELTTNAHNHGAWSEDDGIVSIAWEVRDHPSPGIALSWRESGGPEVARPAEIGLGTRLIERGLAKVLDSEVQLDFHPEGVRMDLWMPLPAEQ